MSEYDGPNADDLSDKRKKVRWAWEQGERSEREIARRTGISKTTVHRIMSEESFRRETGTDERTRPRARTRVQETRSGDESGPDESTDENEPGMDQRTTRAEKELLDEESGSPGSGPAPDPAGSSESPPEASPDASTYGRSQSRVPGKSSRKGPEKAVDVRTALEESEKQREAVEEQLHAAQEQLKSMNRMLQANMQGATQDGIVGEEVAGRPSLANFRKNTWLNFAKNVIDLPRLGLRLGRERAREVAAGTLLPDLLTLSLGEPKTEKSAYTRDWLEHFITDRAKFNVLIGDDEAGRGMRTLFLQQVSLHFYGASVKRLFERAQENFIPGMGMMPEQ